MKSTSSLSEILDAMTHSTSGNCFLLMKSSMRQVLIVLSQIIIKLPFPGHSFFVQHSSLPSMTFTSADAVQWLIQHVEGINDGDDAAAVMKKMLSEKKICHASGDFSLPFIIGFYLYHVCVHESDSKGKENSQHLKTFVRSVYNMNSNSPKQMQITVHHCKIFIVLKMNGWR